MRNRKNIIILGEVLGQNVIVNECFDSICRISPIIIRDFIKLINTTCYFRRSVEIYKYNFLDINCINIYFKNSTQRANVVLSYVLNSNDELELSHTRVYLNDEFEETMHLLSKNKSDLSSITESYDLEEASLDLSECNEVEIDETVEVSMVEDVENTIEGKSQEQDYESQEQENVLEEEQELQEQQEPQVEVVKEEKLFNENVEVASGVVPNVIEDIKFEDIDDESDVGHVDNNGKPFDSIYGNSVMRDYFSGNKQRQTKDIIGSALYDDADYVNEDIVRDGSDKLVKNDTGLSQVAENNLKETINENNNGQPVLPVNDSIKENGVDVIESITDVVEDKAQEVVEKALEENTPENAVQENIVECKEEATEVQDEVSQKEVSEEENEVLLEDIESEFVAEGANDSDEEIEEAEKAEEVDIADSVDNTKDEDDEFVENNSEEDFEIDDKDEDTQEEVDEFVGDNKEVIDETEDEFFDEIDNEENQKTEDEFEFDEDLDDIEDELTEEEELENKLSELEIFDKLKDDFCEISSTIPTVTYDDVYEYIKEQEIRERKARIAASNADRLNDLFDGINLDADEDVRGFKTNIAKDMSKKDKMKMYKNKLKGFDEHLTVDKINALKAQIQRIQQTEDFDEDLVLDAQVELLADKNAKAFRILGGDDSDDAIQLDDNLFMTKNKLYRWGDTVIVD